MSENRREEIGYGTHITFFWFIGFIAFFAKVHMQIFHKFHLSISLHLHVSGGIINHHIKVLYVLHIDALEELPTRKFKRFKNENSPNLPILGTSIHIIIYFFDKSLARTQKTIIFSYICNFKR